MLQRRGKGYTSRIIIPTDLQPFLGRVEITRSLRTGDRREASRRLSLWETHVGAYLSTVRRQRYKMTREQLDELTLRYLDTTFDQIEGRLALEWSEAGLDQHRWDLNDEAHGLAAALANLDYTSGLPWAHAMAPDATEENLRKLARRLIEAKLETVKAELGALAGEPLQRPQAVPATVGAPSIAPAKNTPRVSELATLYGDERVSLKRWSRRTEFLHRTIYNHLADLLGDPPIGKVTKEHIRLLGHAVIKLPSNLGKLFPGLSATEALKATADDLTVARLAPRSVNKYLQMTRSLFKWATEHDYIAQNPATILRDVKEGRARDDRKPFSDADLLAYFAKLDSEPDCPPFLYWIPRILAYSGARLGEVAQLRKDDVRTEDGIWVFDVNEENDEQQLKNEASRRNVPVHPRLVELGLLDFVAACSDEFLWPADMRTTDNPVRGRVDKLSKLLGRRLRSAGIKDPKKVAAHSFRHTISKRLKAHNIPDYQISDILGHEDESESTGRYGDNTDLAKLHETLSLVRLPI